MLQQQHGTPLKPDDHSELVPLLPIPNRTVKRLSADDSADSRVKVGHRQATYSQEKRPETIGALFLFHDDSSPTLRRTVFTSRSYTALVKSYGLQQEFITPYSPEQNGMVERVIRTLKDQCVHRHRFETLQHASRVIGDWIQDRCITSPIIRPKQKSC